MNRKITLGIIFILFASMISTSEAYGCTPIPSPSPTIITNHASVWFNGIDNPSQSIGNNTDYYLDTTTYDIYYKSNDTWNLIGNILGKNGTNGIGLNGNDGINATNGKDGRDGNGFNETGNIIIFNGTDGRDGITTYIYQQSNITKVINSDGTPGVNGTNGTTTLLIRYVYAEPPNINLLLALLIILSAICIILVAIIIKRVDKK
jgi:hypothetical protein